jgi:hypothetical protein
MGATDLPVDSGDPSPVVHDDQRTASFMMSKYVDAKTGPGRHDIKPLGIITYLVTIEAKYVPYEDA